MKFHWRRNKRDAWFTVNTPPADPHKRPFSSSDIIMGGRKGLGNGYRSTGKGTRRNETSRWSYVFVCLLLPHCDKRPRVRIREPWCIKQCPWDGRPPPPLHDCAAAGRPERRLVRVRIGVSFARRKPLSARFASLLSTFLVLHDLEPKAFHSQRHRELPVTGCNVASINVAARHSIVGGLRRTVVRELVYRA